MQSPLLLGSKSANENKRLFAPNLRPELTMMEFIFLILPVLAILACVLLFTVPGIWGAFFTMSLLGHKMQWFGLDKDKDEQ